MRRLYLVEQQNQAVFQCWRTTELWVATSCQQPQQGVEDGRVLQQRLLGLTDEHLKQLQQRALAIRVQASTEVPLNQTLQNILRDHHLQYGTHGLHASATVWALSGPFLCQQTQHLVGVIPHSRQVIA